MKLLYLDCETTGLDAISDGLIQIAGIVEIDGVVVEEFNIRLQPIKDSMVSKKALECNGLTMEEIRKFPLPEVGYRQFKAILDKYVDKYDRGDKFYTVGQNVGFDIGFIDTFFHKLGDRYSGSYFHYHKIDLIAITTLMKIAGRITLPNMKLETVMKELGVGEQTHDALDDVRAVRDVFYIYVGWVKALMS